jgi:hypothetical protein
MPNYMRYCQTCRFEIDKRFFKRHTLSVVHRKANLIRAMLERDCITQAEIARRIGLTRERVRQLALQMGSPMGERGTPFAEWSVVRKKWRSFLWKRKNAGFPLSCSGRGVLT